ncbi:nucleic acid-binding, OB-fold-like protein isoform X2 [Wolffia australiana]
MATTGSSPVGQGIVSALSKRLSGISLEQISSTTNERDLVCLLKSVPDLLGQKGNLNMKNEVLKWINFSEKFLADEESHDASLRILNEHLKDRAVLLCGLEISEADIVVFSAVHSVVSRFSDVDREGMPHVIRWMDYVQSMEDFGGAFVKISVQKAPFESQKKAPSESKAAEPKKKTKEKEKETTGKDLEVSVTPLNIQVGLIRTAQKHPSADSLLVEEIDLGDGNIRQVVSGLAKFYSPDDLVNRRVVLITNVKPGKLRDVTSYGLVLCASSEDHSVVEPLLPPEGASLGECISFSGYEGKPEDVLNPKKKQLEKITPHLFTDGNGVATFKGIPFMTSAGPCTSSLPSAAIK